MQTEVLLVGCIYAHGELHCASTRPLLGLLLGVEVAMVVVAMVVAWASFRRLRGPSCLRHTHQALWQHR